MGEARDVADSMAAAKCRVGLGRASQIYRPAMGRIKQKVFKTAQEAVDAVLEGFRPTQGLPKKAGQIVELPGKNSSI
jgi:hypothetical protein